MPLHLPTGKGPHRHLIGAGPLHVADWFDAGPGAQEQLAAKPGVLAEHHDEAVAVLPGADAACAELLAMIEAHLGVEHEPSDLHPIEQAGLLVAEDLCLHLPDAFGRQVLVAASLCFPFRWVLAEKLGRPLGAIHAPIPGYPEQIESPVDKLVARLTPERGVLRHNVSLLDWADLFQPRRPDVGPQPVPTGFFVRSERQTLRVLPQTGAMVFTIRTTVVPIVDLDGDGRARMAGWLRGLTPELLDYRELTDDRDRLLEWLEA